MFSNQQFRDSFSKARSKVLMSYMNKLNKGLNMMEIILSTDLFQEALIVNAKELKQQITANKNSDQKIQVFKLTIEADDADLNDIIQADNKKILFLAMEEYDFKSVGTKRTAHYRRILSEDNTNTPNSIYYEPEGTEFSIYYADTYLYITPDIFTGLMTGLFIFFVLLIGLSCLGSIQGMNNFYDKTPSVGKEA